MGVNIFVPINQADATDENLTSIVNEANKFGTDDSVPYSWVDLFRGESGYLLTLEQALAFNEREAPWFLLLKIYPEGEPGEQHEIFYCNTEASEAWEDDLGPTSQVEPVDWRQLLKDSKCDSVLLLKARN